MKQYGGMLFPVAISCYKQLVNNKNNKLCQWVIVTQTLQLCASNTAALLISNLHFILTKQI